MSAQAVQEKDVSSGPFTRNSSNRPVKSNPGAGLNGRDTERQGPATEHLSRGTRYPLRVAEFARRLYESGRTIPEVQAALASRGYRPTRKSVIHWCEPETRDAYNLRRNALLWPAANRRKRDKPWTVKRDRLFELRSIGLSLTAIAKVMNHDFGLALDHEQTRRIVNDAMTEASICALMEGKRIRRGVGGAAE